MTELLRGALEEIAERAPELHIPDDVWDRAQRSRRRGTIATAAAVMAVVISAAGLGMTATHRASPADVSGQAPALPSRLYAVPDGITATSDGGLAVGQASIAFATGSGVPVVVDAHDGRYHALDLPGYVGVSTPLAFVEGPSLALSPDGRWLAYPFVTGVRGDGTAQESGFRVLDLTTGAIRTTDLGSPQRGLEVRSLAWSPDSRWLAWSGNGVTSWTTGSTTYRGIARGRLAPGTTTSTSLPSPQDANTAMAIDDNGRVALLTTARLRIVDPSGRVSTYPVAMPGTVMNGGTATPRMAFSPSGDSLAIPSSSPEHHVRLIDPETGRVRQQRVGGTAPDGATADPLGWAAADLPVYLVSQRSGTDTPSRRIEVIGGWPPGAFPSSSVVTRMSGLVPEQLSIAVDLLAGDRRSRDFPPPTWPSTSGDSSRIWLAALGLAGLSGLGGTMWLAVRRRRRLG
jgi:LPXTG-motif cell wall-anchored protein